MNPIKNRNRGKATERAIASRMSGERVGILGGEDISHPVFSVEVKARQKFVASEWMSQAVRNAPDGKTPLVVVHLKGQRHDNDLVVIRMRDFEDYNGRLSSEPQL
ncbi:MAG: hypothetical protein HQK92_06315 [Nitrospirae bacterium]|nr:hypothetical protein [Nitrospirota bacterium]